MSMAVSVPVALVTGGVRGVGAGITRAYLRAGYTVVACARRDVDVPIQVDGRVATYMPCDVRNESDVVNTVDAILTQYGRLDTVVNNAGGAPFALAHNASANFHRKIVELNLLAPLLVAQAANSVMQDQETGGSIVMISSVSAQRPSPGTAAYGAAKAGLDSLTKSLAVEWAPKVRVNGLAVGMVETEQSELHYGDADGIARVARTVPLGRLASPEDVGNSAVFLSSESASYISGATLTVHGGGERPSFLDAATTNN
ncbi:SDR family oxidoreductase [Rhodococcus sp. 077-4]|uniref:SDR family oxidoreductase n=1 Tax=Rhodococcus sp. 077-4 TaxID=2789271 RepID=UPI0039F47842